MSQGNYSIFLRPISLAFIIVAVAAFCWPFLSKLLKQRKAAKVGRE